MSEKLDGVRGYWNGTKMLSKQGKEIICPEYFTKDLPHTALDGELWLGRGTFNKLVGMLSSRSATETWKEVKYMIFDIPDSKDPIEIRIQEMNRLVLPPHVRIVENTKYSENLEKVLSEVVKGGGEGLVLRAPGSLYVAGRNDSILKVKVILNRF